MDFHPTLPTSEQEETDVVTISGEYFRALLEDRKLLCALYDAGVDNWDGYDFAMENAQDD